MEQGKGGYHAIRGRCLHYCIEHMWFPFDIPADEEKEITLAILALDSLKKDGWEIFGREIYLENERLSGNLDLVIERENEVAYVDAKFGMKKVLNSSPQLLGGLELLMDNYPDKWDFFWTGIIQPFHLKFGEKLNFTQWNKTQINETINMVLETKNSMHDSCAYCIKWVNGRCPAFKSVISSLDRITQWKVV